MLRILSEENSIANQYLLEIRDKEIQKDQMRFRSNIGRIGQIFAYEISKTLSYQSNQVETQLGLASMNTPSEDIVIASILRAGIPFHEGMLRIFDKAESAFFSAYRMHHKDGTFEIKMEYMSCPVLDDKILILSDPMLATGASASKVLKALAKQGKPRRTHFVSVIASRYGVDYISRNFPNIDLWTLAVDEELTAKSYIVPGLGDAGDLMYGTKSGD